jgi:hypothetical protein
MRKFQQLSQLFYSSNDLPHQNTSYLIVYGEMPADTILNINAYSVCICIFLNVCMCVWIAIN